MEITDALFRELLSIEKHFVVTGVKLPERGGRVSYELRDAFDRERFNLDINKSGRIELSKATLQDRYGAIPLIRLDLDAQPHQNPDGIFLSRNHIHIFREGYGDAWAYDINSFSEFKFNDYKSDADFENIFDNFCDYCNIIIPNYQFSMKKGTP